MRLFFQKYRHSWSNCIKARVLPQYSRICHTRVFYVLTLYCLQYMVQNYYVLCIHSLLLISFTMYVIFPSFPFNPIASSVVELRNSSYVVFLIKCVFIQKTVHFLSLRHKMKQCTQMVEKVCYIKYYVKKYCSSIIQFSQCDISINV